VANYTPSLDKRKHRSLAALSCCGLMPVGQTQSPFAVGDAFPLLDNDAQLILCTEERPIRDSVSVAGFLDICFQSRAIA
jgi:hypothetical protein